MTFTNTYTSRKRGKTFLKRPKLFSAINWKITNTYTVVLVPSIIL